LGGSGGFWGGVFTPGEDGMVARAQQVQCKQRQSRRIVDAGFGALVHTVISVDPDEVELSSGVGKAEEGQVLCPEVQLFCGKNVFFALEK